MCIAFSMFLDSLWEYHSCVLLLLYICLISLHAGNLDPVEQEDYKQLKHYDTVNETASQKNITKVYLPGL